MTVTITMEKKSSEKKSGQNSKHEKIYRLIGLLGILVAICLGLFLIYNGTCTAGEFKVDPDSNNFKGEEQEERKEMNETQSLITVKYRHNWGAFNETKINENALVSELISHLKLVANYKRDIFLMKTTEGVKTERMNPEKKFLRTFLKRMSTCKFTQGSKLAKRRPPAVIVRHS